MIHVVIPSQLESYTHGVRELKLGPQHCATLAEVMAVLDSRYPGIRFRIVDEQGSIRRHIAIFVGETLVRTLAMPLSGDERVQIVGALSGG